MGQPRNYGLSLALGGGEVPPLQMAGGFAALANQGRYIEPYTISRIEDGRSNLLYEYVLPTAAEAQVVSEEDAYLLSSILSDNNARQPEFGVNNLLQIPGHRVAVKTGTSGSSANDVRDGWTIGYTPHVATAVWVGNTSNQPIGQGQSGYQLAAPIWNSYMTQFHADKQPLDFIRPPGIIDAEICAESGTRPGADCLSRIVEQFAGSHPPLDSSQDFLQKVSIDLWTNLRANNNCEDAVYDANFFQLLVSGNADVQNRERTNAQRWLEQTSAGQFWASQRSVPIPLALPPEQECDGNTPRPEVAISQPQNNDEVLDTIEIQGTAKGPNFAGYIVDWGISHDPGGWGEVQGRRGEQVENGLLATWDLVDIEYEGPLTIRVVIYGPDNPYTPENDPITKEVRVLLSQAAANAHAHNDAYGNADGNLDDNTYRHANADTDVYAQPDNGRYPTHSHARSAAAHGRTVTNCHLRASSFGDPHRAANRNNHPLMSNPEPVSFQNETGSFLVICSIFLKWENAWGLSLSKPSAECEPVETCWLSLSKPSSPRF